MTTATKKTPNTETAAAATETRIKESLDGYIDQLIDGHQHFADAVSSARGRHARVADKFVEALVDSQRDALQLGKTIVGEPTAYAKNMEAFMDSMTSVQERVLDVAKTLYREQAEAATAAHTMIEPLIAAGGNLGKPFEKMTEVWARAVK